MRRVEYPGPIDLHDPPHAQTIQADDPLHRLLELLRRRPDWEPAMDRACALHELRGDHALREARRYADHYAFRRSAMVFDAVASRQRRPGRRLLPLIEQFAQSPAAVSLNALGERGPGHGWGLRPGEPELMQSIAAGLSRFATHRGLDEEAGVRAWATSTTILVATPAVDPYVGGLPGVALVLFADLRLRSGGDGIKPDLRVRAALRFLGFEVPDGEPALLMLAAAVAAELDQPLLVLDHLLWSVTDGSVTPSQVGARSDQVVDLRVHGNGRALHGLQAEFAGQ